MILIRLSRSIVISQSQITNCIRQQNGGLSCSLELLLNAVVTTGSEGTDAILVESILDDTGNPIKLASPISISVSKAPVIVRYSLVYVSDVNSEPREVIGTTSLISCSTGSSSLLRNNACGALYFNGAYVRNSEGYCCACTLDQMLGLGSAERGNTGCNLLSGVSSDGAFVHCLRWGSLWYSIFEIVTPAVDSKVLVTGDAGLDMLLDSQKPSSTEIINGTLNVTASLVGSFQWSRPPSDWGQSSYAACPNIAGSPNADPEDPRIRTYDSNNPCKLGMLISKTAFDLTGDSCNKIGVSHYAFVNDQANRCSGQIGNCLHNQIEGIWDSSKPGDFIPDQLCATIGGTFIENDGFRLSCALMDSSSDVPTQILIRMNAKDISLISNASSGIILNVTTSNDLQALSQKTTVSVLIQNTGNLTSQFNVGIRDCSSASLMFPLSSSIISILPHRNATVDIKIDDSQIAGGNYTCDAFLTDGRGQELSSFSFRLSITATSTDRGSQESSGNSGESNATAVSPNGASAGGCERCSGFFSVFCFLSNKCWSGLGSLLGTVGGIGLVLGLMTKFGGWTIIWKLLKCICSSCCNSSTKPAKRRYSDTEIPTEAQYFYGNTGRPFPQYNMQMYSTGWKGFENI